MSSARNFKTVPIPEYMRDLNKDVRGYPIPFVVYVDQLQKPHFKINDQHKQKRCFKYSLCHICGNKIPEDDQWITGGPASALHPRGVFVDGPAHHDCIEYALKVCPYLGFTKYISDKDEEALNKLKKVGINKEQTLLVYDPTVTLDKVPFFVCGQIKGFFLTDCGHIKVWKPYLQKQYWRDGKIITTEEAIELLKSAEDQEHFSEIIKNI